MTTTPIYLPESLQYPIVITSIAAQPSSTVARGTKLLNYSFEFTPRRTYSPDPAVKPPPPKTEKRFSSWEATSDGVVKEWHFRPGQRVTLKEAKDTPALTLLEECPHSMQIAGLCTQCGKDMTITDYIGITDESRAGIRMTHDAAGPTVSAHEARRIEQETADKLRGARKLILIVDLDQTIVHATVDPTVGEWIAQGKAYENRMAEKAAAKAAKGAALPKDDDDDDTASDSDSEIEEEEKEEAEKETGTQLVNGHINGAKEKNGHEHHHHHHKGKALLSNNDWELERVWNILHEVHRRYYEAEDENKANSVTLQGKGKQKGSLAKNNKVPDVAFIIPALKSEVLAGVRILFSSVIPLGTSPEQSEAWRCAREFGAKCATRLTDEVTHVVAAKEGTHKVLEAFHKGNVKVVWTKWFNDCIALWKHLEEKDDYMLPMPSKRALDSIDASATPGSHTGNEFNGEAGPSVDDTGTPGTGTGTPVGTPRMPELHLDWDAAQDELDAFLAETDDEGDEGGEDDEKIDEDEAGDEDDGPDREGRDRNFGARDMDELLAEDEAMDVAYGEPSGSKTVLKRPRGGTPNSTASDSEDDVTPSAKRTKLAPGPSAPNPISTPDEETDEDEEMTGSKPGSIALSGPGAENEEEEDEDEDGEDEEEGSSAAEGFDDSGSDDDDSDDSEDDDFLNELSAASDGPG
ncbi:Carboxy-terminal domain (CTD) phosphatase [Tulasnella sp. 417]|nr:Carboxy-terminal domain (CTD) phosphatase [Tulasnella sp. 417]